MRYTILENYKKGSAITIIAAFDYTPTANAGYVEFMQAAIDAAKEQYADFDKGAKYAIYAEGKISSIGRKCCQFQF